MAYYGALRLLRLAQEMAGTTRGLSLAEIQERFEVSRRTAERMRDAAIELVGRENVEELREEDGLKRWRVRGAAVPRLPLAAADLAALEAGARLLERDNRGEEAERLRALAHALRPSSGAQRARLETDLEALLEAEGLAARPGPRVRVDPAAVAVLREGILACRKVAFTYRGRLDPTPRERVVEPYGFLYGTRPYLVARREGAEGFRHYRLQGISEARLTDEPFTREQGFTIEAHARRCFGTFLEEPFDVVWRFRPSAAQDAAEYVFHPDQRVETDAEGGLIVRFRAGGALEMAWHLLTWGDTVEVLEPPDFWQRAEASRARFA